MIARMVTLLALVAVCLALLAAPVQSKPLEDQRWIEVRTDHFTIRSLNSKRQTKKVARLLEMMRATVPESILRSRNTPADS